jgi:hypothetical protein
MPLGPFDLTGGPFLLLYGVLLIFTIIVGIAIPRWLRPEGRAARNPDVDHLAFLAGGTSRLAEAVTTRLLATKQLVMDGKKFLAGGLGGTTAAERSVLALPQPASWEAVAGSSCASGRPRPISCCSPSAGPSSRSAKRAGSRSASSFRCW